MMSALYDTLIIGAGPSGLAAALGLSRALRTCVIFGKDEYRNDKARHMHTVPGHDHIEPHVYRARAKDELVGGRYETTLFADVDAVVIERTSARRFQVIDSKGNKWQGKTVILATGVKDVMADIHGYEAAWGRSIWQCLFCDGYEQRNSQSAGVLLARPLAAMPIESHIMQSMLARRFAKEVTIFTNGDEEVLSNAKLQAVCRAGIQVDTRKLDKIVSPYPNDVLRTEIDLVFVNGPGKRLSFLVHKPRTAASANFTSLDLERTDMGDIKTFGMFGQTSTPGVFAAGDSTLLMKAVVPAQSSGITAAAGVHHALLEDELNS